MSRRRGCASVARPEEARAAETRALHRGGTLRGGRAAVLIWRQHRPASKVGFAAPLDALLMPRRAVLRCNSEQGPPSTEIRRCLLIGRPRARRNRRALLSPGRLRKFPARFVIFLPL